MGLETTTVISGLDATFPTTADAIQQGDDHIRLIKAVLKNCFPNVNAPLTASMVPNVPAGNLAATTVQAALNELDSEKVPLSGAGATGTWGISVSGSAASSSTAGSAASLSGTAVANINSAALGTGTADGTKVLKGDRTWGTLPAADSVPAGAVMHFAMNTAPTGWLKANGAAVDRTTYATLFAAIGTIFGIGNGSTTFNLPDLRGEFVRGWDDAKGADSGRGFGTAQSSQNLAHNHGGGTGGASTNSGSPGNAEVSFNTPLSVATSGTSTHSHSIGSDGGTEARPRNIALLACIKY